MLRTVELENDIKVFIDVNKLKQVIINLVSNAFKFSKENSEVLISAKTDHKKVIIEIIDS